MDSVPLVSLLVLMFLIYFILFYSPIFLFFFFFILPVWFHNRYYYMFQYSLDFLVACRESNCDILMSSQRSLHRKTVRNKHQKVLYLVGEGELRGNFGTGVRASISKPTPFIYLAFEKTDPFICLIIQNVDLFIYCPLIFCSHFLLVITQISQSIHVIPRG